MDHEKRAHLLSIGEMAEANRVSIATLRLYDRMGLLQPSYRDEETNYRYYDIRQTSRLDIIRYMRNLNMSLTDIQTLLEKEDIMLIEQKLIEKNNQIHQQMRDLKAMHEAVERTIQSIERYRKSPVSGTISLEFIDQRHILYIPCAENFYEQGIVAYEKAVLALRRELMGRNLPQLLSYSLGTSVKQDDFARGAHRGQDLHLRRQAPARLRRQHRGHRKRHVRLRLSRRLRRGGRGRGAPSCILPRQSLYFERRLYLRGDDGAESFR